MLSREDNELLTRVGPGTPMGSLMRCYWLPLLERDELGPPDAPPRRVRLLGENLVVFRDTRGDVGLLEEACPHRGASLFFGRNEEHGLRCVYHGWKFDAHGACLELPTEPPGSPLREGLRARAYACRERQGIVWAYLGRRPDPPELPDLPWALVPALQRSAFKYQRACNWLQALEGDLDTAHLGFLHARNEEGGGRAVSYGVEDRMRDIAVSDTRPRIEPHATPAGIAIGARRVHDATSDYWRITQFLMPIYTSVPAIGEQRRAKAWVPMDDHHTWVWEPNWHPARPLSDDERRGTRGRLPQSGMQAEDGDPLSRGRFVAGLGNDYLIDRERQRATNFSGLEESPPLQDAAVQESMGPIVDRSREHLGASDVAIVRVRQLLLDSARRLRAHGEPPPGADDPGAYRRRGWQRLLPQSADWREVSRQCEAD